MMTLRSNRRPTPSEREPASRRRQAQRLGLIALAGVAALSVWFVLRFVWTRQYSLDEFDYAHLSWLVSQGFVPYRDFFDHHFPLLYQLLAGILRLVGDSPEVVRWLRCALLPGVVALGWSVYSLNRRFVGRNWALIAVLVLFGNPTFLQFATEIRPDGLALAAFLSALALLERRTGSDGRRTALAAGLLLGVAVWSSSKVLIYGSPLGALFLSDLALPTSHRNQRALRSPWSFFGGMLTVVVLAVAILWATDALGPFYQFCFRWSAAHERVGRRFSWWQHLAPVLQRFSWWFLAAAIGVLGTLARIRRAGRWRSRQLALILILATSFASYALQAAPYPYSLLPFLALVGIFAGRGFGMVARALRRRLRPMSSRLVVASGGVLCLLVVMPGLEEALRHDNGYQHQVLGEIDRLVGPQDRVFASSGSFVTRRGVGFFPYTNAFLRQTEAAYLADELPRQLVAEGCVATLIDTRFGSLPDTLRRFLLTHFAPYNSDLWLWGSRYPESLGPSWTATFVASVGGPYFVSWGRSSAGSPLSIDDVSVGDEPFQLAAGVHTLRYRGQPQDLAVLWLPRNGERYAPGLTGPPRFSRLF